MLNGYFFGCLRQDVLEQREQRESTLSLCRVVTKQTIGKSFEEIFYEMLLRKKYCGFAVYLQIKSLTKIIDQNALEFLAFGEGFILDRIGDARNLNENLENNL